jgi:hypothetical protein
LLAKKHGSTPDVVEVITGHIAEDVNSKHFTRYSLAAKNGAQDVLPLRRRLA